MTVDDITYYYKSDKQYYKDYIEKYLICPECRLPNLAYNNDNPPYLSVYPRAKHDDNCSLKQDEMTSKQTSKFINNPDNKELVLRQMESILTMMLNTNVAKSKKHKDSYTNANVSKKQCHNNSNLTSKRIPRKRIDMDFESGDFDCDKIFYGSVKLRWEKDPRTINGIVQNYYKILLYRNKKYDKRMICRLNITPTVYSYIPEEVKSSEEYNCKIVFLAKFKDRGKSYQITSIRNSQFITLEKTD